MKTYPYRLPTLSSKLCCDLDISIKYATFLLVIFKELLSYLMHLILVIP